jgi:hypothetical protein
VARCRGVQEPPYQPTAVTEGIRTPADRSVSPGGFGHTGRVIAGAFAAAIAVGTALLSLPIATAGPGRADFLTALFHGTSAVCVTGLVTVDTGSHWSGFGQATILLLIQAGGLGIMTLATLFALLLSRRLGLRARLIAQAETRALSAADVRLVLRRAVIFSLASEAVAAVVLRQGVGRQEARACGQASPGAHSSTGHPRGARGLRGRLQGVRRRVRRPRLDARALPGLCRGLPALPGRLPSVARQPRLIPPAKTASGPRVPFPGRPRCTGRAKLASTTVCGHSRSRRPRHHPASGYPSPATAQTGGRPVGSTVSTDTTEGATP